MIHLNFNPFPVLETERLLLRNLREYDKHEMFAIRSNPIAMQYIPRPMAKTLEDAAALVELILGNTERNERINWAITEKGSDKMLGVIGYVGFNTNSARAEVGYVLNPDCFGKGIGYEALKAVVNYGFEVIGLHSIEAIIRPENRASIRLVEKLGFVREAYFRDYIYFNGEYLDETVYSLLNQG
ncbi:MAG: GNAT family N-acetyltransferase [Flavipsychrobacter sp.]|nr:GNAT family N-acetyltransferase [Flavipsychrobacter sp.]